VPQEVHCRRAAAARFVPAQAHCIRSSARFVAGALFPSTGLPRMHAIDTRAAPNRESEIPRRRIEPNSSNHSKTTGE